MKKEKGMVIFEILLFILILIITFNIFENQSSSANSTSHKIHFIFQSSISDEDEVPVMLTLEEVGDGNSVDISIAIAEGGGDLLGFFGNFVDENLIQQIVLEDPLGVITQAQFSANDIDSVGNGNNVLPVKKWDFGLRFLEQGSPEFIESVEFRLSAPGLKASSLLEGINQGWIFGVRIQSTTGEEGSAKIGLHESAPIIHILSPVQGSLVNHSPLMVTGSLGGQFPIEVWVNGIAGVIDDNVFTTSIPLTEGFNSIQVVAVNEFAEVSTSASVILDSFAPIVTITSPSNGYVTTDSEILIIGHVTDEHLGTEVMISGQAFPITDDHYQASIPLSLGENLIEVIAEDQAGNIGTNSILVKREDISGELPPDPSTVAPGIDMSVATSIWAATEFLYTGVNPIQDGVQTGTIDPVRISIIRGRVLNENGDALPGVDISILNHPEYGSTLSRADGWFDMAVNGGGGLTVQYRKEGYITLHRPVQTSWQEYVFVEDAVMIAYDTVVTEIDLSLDTIQVARGTPQTDIDGTRQATLLFMPGTQAEMVFTDGSIQQITTLNVRATEFTVGELGPQRMPAPLPPTSGYTYSPEFSVDEAVVAGATEVQFSQPVFFYLENFVGFEVGGIVPAGYYDRAKGAWIASPNGLVVQILGTTGDLADLDLDGNGNPGSASDYAALNITDQERAQIAQLYGQGTVLWRTPVDHFSPFECNWPYGPPEDVRNPEQPPPKEEEKKDKDCKEPAQCFIENSNQILGESHSIIGTPYDLNYRSDRVEGRVASYTLDIPLSGDSIPASLSGILLEVRVAGNLFKQRFPAATNQSTTFIWDGRDAYGRLMQGEQAVRVRIGYEYDAVFYRDPAQVLQSFLRASESGIVLQQSRDRLTYYTWQEWTGMIGTWKEIGSGLGGWSLDAHHAYDPVGKVLYLGNGARRSAAALRVIEPFAGNGIVGSGEVLDGELALDAEFNLPVIVAADPDGSVYLVDDDFPRIRRVDPEGIITTFAGNGIFGGDVGDGGPATEASIGYTYGIAVGPDGSVYFGGYWDYRIRKVDPEGIITTVAGNGIEGSSGDEGPATEAQICNVDGLAVSPDGTIYFRDSCSSSYPWRDTVRAIGTDGIIFTVAGTGINGYSGDGGPAVQAQISWGWGLAVDNDGNLIIADTANHVVRKVTSDGIIHTIAGTGEMGPWFGPAECDGCPATEAPLYYPDTVAVGSDGTLYISEGYRIRAVSPEGIIYTYAGSGIKPPYRGGYPGDGPVNDGGDGGFANAAIFQYVWGIAVGPDDSLYVVDMGDARVRKISPPYPGFSASEIAIASEDGQQIYRFDASGRHLETINALTGITLYSFEYNENGTLKSIQDRDGNQTIIEHDASGRPTAVVAPFGQRTELTTDSQGYLASITNPMNVIWQLGYTTEGLLVDQINPLGLQKTYLYDQGGRLIRAADSVGGYTELSCSESANEVTVTKTTASGITTQYISETLPTGEQHRRTVFPDGTVTEVFTQTDGNQTLITPDGSEYSTTVSADPRWGIQAPVLSTRFITPGGLTLVQDKDRSVELADKYNPFSLTSSTSQTSINGRLFTQTYDSGTNSITSHTEEGRSTNWIYDVNGRLVKWENTSLSDLEMTYDSFGRTTDVTWGPRLLHAEYGVDGWISSTNDAQSHVYNYETDTAGKITALTLPDGAVVNYGYDAMDNLTAITPPGQPVHSLGYTTFGNLSEYNAPSLGLGESPLSFTYDLDKRLTQILRPDGGSIEFLYDVAGRLSETKLFQGQFTRSYDPQTGLLSSITAPDGGVLSYQYDGSLLTDQTWAGEIQGEVNDTYDDNLYKESRSVNGANPIYFTYDGDRLLTSAGDLSIGRDVDTGQVTSTDLGNITTERTFTNLGELQSYDVIYNGATIYSVTYTHDVLGRVVEKVVTFYSQVKTYSYEYDARGQLVLVKENGIIVNSYSYDDNGNRQTKTNNTGTLTASYDVQDRLINFGNLEYTYTLSGDLLQKTNSTSGETTTFQYDALGNLLAVELDHGRRIDYVIDGQNRRVGKKVDGVLVGGYLYKDQLNPVAELDGSGNVVARFVYGTCRNVPDYMIREGHIYRIISDHLGSPLMIVDTDSGVIVQRMEYDEYGNVLFDDNPGFQPFGFAGGLYDPDTKLTRFGVRDYDAEAGRWTTKDPILFIGGTTNLYQYANNDPVNYIDINGYQQMPTIVMPTIGFPYHSLGALANALLYEVQMQQFIDTYLPDFVGDTEIDKNDFSIADREAIQEWLMWECVDQHGTINRRPVTQDLQGIWEYNMFMRIIELGPRLDELWEQGKIDQFLYWFGEFNAMMEAGYQPPRSK